MIATTSEKSAAMPPHALAAAILTAGLLLLPGSEAEAKSCSQLRALCWTMRAAKSDCTAPHLRCSRVRGVRHPARPPLPCNGAELGHPPAHQLLAHLSRVHACSRRAASAISAVAPA